MEVIVGSQRVKLNVDFERQDFVRDTEDEIYRVFSTLRKRFPRKDERELLAMIVYQFASYYRGILDERDEALRLARECEERLDGIADSPEA